MQPAKVLGSTHATVKHESFVGQRMLVVQPLGVDQKTDGPPLIAIDAFGARKGDHVLLSSDGAYAQAALDNKNTPARWTVMGIIDQ